MEKTSVRAVRKSKPRTGKSPERRSASSACFPAQDVRVLDGTLTTTRQPTISDERVHWSQEPGPSGESSHQPRTQKKKSSEPSSPVVGSETIVLVQVETIPEAEIPKVVPIARVQPVRRIPVVVSDSPDRRFMRGESEETLPESNAWMIDDVFFSDDSSDARWHQQRMATRRAAEEMDSSARAAQVEAWEQAAQEAELREQAARDAESRERAAEIREQIARAAEARERAAEARRRAEEPIIIELSDTEDEIPEVPLPPPPPRRRRHHRRPQLADCPPMYASPRFLGHLTVLNGRIYVRVPDGPFFNIIPTGEFHYLRWPQRRDFRTFAEWRSGRGNFVRTFNRFFLSVDPPPPPPTVPEASLR